MALFFVMIKIIMEICFFRANLLEPNLKYSHTHTRNCPSFVNLTRETGKTMNYNYVKNYCKYKYEKSNENIIKICYTKRIIFHHSIVFQGKCPVLA